MNKKLFKNLLTEAKKLPETSGVYKFVDRNNKVLYVGRAVNLKKRVLSYFNKSLDLRILEMVESANKIKYQKTETLLEAIILEANLIKKYWPKYNVKEKDNRSFIYIVIAKDKYPKVLFVRGRELQKFLSKKFYIFGPYQSFSLIKNALKIIRRIFPYSNCTPFVGKPCFDYQIGLCPGICIGKIEEEEYKKNIQNIILLLSGKKKRLLEKLKKENPELIKGIKHLEDVSLVLKENLPYFSHFSRIEGYDISHLAGKETFGAMVVFVNNEPDKSQYRLFKIKEAPKNDDLRALSEVITRRFRHQEWQYPDLILIDGGRSQVKFIFKILKSLYLNMPLVGISKYSKDKLVFPAELKKNLKELISNNKDLLLKIRNEAHRFSLKSSRNQRKLKHLT